MSHYNPYQPRVPKGHPNGGEWERRGSAPGVFVRPAFAGPATPFIFSVELAKTLELAGALFAALSLSNTPGKRALFEFQALDPKAEKGPMKFEGVRTITEEEAEEFCKKLGGVQSATDKFAAAARVQGLTGSRLGTEVHTRLAEAVNGKNRTAKNPRDPDFIAEISKMKLEEELGLGRVIIPRDGAAHYAEAGSVRYDVFENLRSEKTVCIYDVKTAGRGLSLRRMLELAGTVVENFGPTHVVVIEVRPRQVTNSPNSSEP
jgi:hypothetical protein